MTVFFTSDTHFGHENILQYSDRGKLWNNASDMNEALIERWNSVVGMTDTVYHLGDVMWHPKRSDQVLGRLNGRIHLITGNHDHTATRKHFRFESVQPLLILKGVDKMPITLCHYGMRVWNMSHHGALHFYGHSHGSLPGNSQSCDVGVDVPEWDYTPVSFDVLSRHLKTLPAFGQEDYHDRR